MTFAISANAQKLPTFSAAKEITKGTLPNNVSYYIAKNASCKGYADFALIQKGRTDVEGIRNCLAQVPHFSDVKPYEFLARHGVGYSAVGYVYSVPAAKVVRFSDVPTYENSVTDSTLLLLFDIMDTYPAEQAIIVCGDVDASQILERMKILSMMVSEREKRSVQGGYKWEQVDTIRVVTARTLSPNTTAVTVRYSTPRTAKSEMNTILPYINQMLAMYCETILKGRVRASFKDAGVPLANVTYRYSGTNISSADEVRELSVFVKNDDVYRATRLMGALLSDLARGGCTPQEFEESHRHTIEKQTMSYSTPYTNREYLDMCEAAFCYGAGLVAKSDVQAFFAKKRVPIDKERELFNEYIQALVDRQKNLTLVITSKDVDMEKAKDLFFEGWDDMTPVTPEWELPDTALFDVSPRKVRITTTATEPMTGGSLITFSNGVKVICKKGEGNIGLIGYSILLKGGPTSVQGMTPEESVYVGDMFSISNVAGMDQEEFRSFLASNGITMSASVGLSDMRIVGTVEQSSLPMLMKILAAMSTKRTITPESYEYFKQNERVRLDLSKRTREGANAVLDSLFSPEYCRYRHKTAAGLTDALPEKANRYFQSQFSKINDGVFVFVGDLNEDKVKQTMTEYLGAFQTSRQYSSKPTVRYELTDSWHTRFSDAESTTFGERQVGTNIGMASRKNYSLSNNMTFKIALLAIERKLSAALAKEGVYVSVTGEMEMFPVERITVYIYARPSVPSGLPTGVVVADQKKVLLAMRKALTNMASKPIPASELSIYKSALTAKEETRNISKDEVVKSVITRYSSGRDVVTGYKDAIKSVTPAAVQEILKSLDNGSKVEYVVQ